MVIKMYNYSYHWNRDKSFSIYLVINMESVKVYHCVKEDRKKNCQILVEEDGKTFVGPPVREM